MQHDNDLHQVIDLQMQDPVHLGGLICQLGSASIFRFTLKVQGQSVISVVDTVAEVTIISDKVFESFIKKPPIKEKQQCRQQGVSKNNTRLQKINIFFINGEALPMIHGDVGLVPPVNAIARVAKITVPHRTVIPPNSVVQLESDLSAELTDFIIKPNKKIDLLIPRGEAIEADVVETGPAPSVATTGIARDNNPLQEQLQNILDKSTSHQDCKSFETIGPHTVLLSSLISDENLPKQDNTQHIHVITEDNTRPDSSIPQDEDQNVTSHVKESPKVHFRSSNKYLTVQIKIQ
ncbi:proA [Mytilus edulis]|uniref:ProA n=1 Tax=Mytilus edulis TaxID=6550 RepID=A0A8S3QA85_MYTED|nr:proA [Mytilus edulis]